MGLYLCVFADDTDDEVDGVEVGGYDDFHSFRLAVAERLESGEWGSRFPVLMMHPDSEGEWTPAQAAGLERELLAIGDELARLPAAPIEEGWRHDVVKQLGIEPATLLDCYFDIDGEPLVERLIGLTRAARQIDQPISFQ